MSYSRSILDDLIWQVEAGADEALEEVAGFQHWKASPLKEASKAAKPPPSLVEFAPLRAPPVPTPPAALLRPVEAASLPDLRAALESFDGCELKKTAMNLVFAEGDPLAEIMVIGDVPAEEEDRQGQPFVGAKGQLLDRMLASIGVDRSQVYLTNLVFWRPPGNRTPSEAELAACLPFTVQHIRLKAPKLILLFGHLTAKTLLRTKEPFSKIRGRWTEYFPAGADPSLSSVPCLCTYHPTYLMRQPASKRQAWADLLLFKEKINKII
ncbi:MAG: uracil-DNA glycosylase [Bdellovibrionales bacterium]